MANNGYNAMVSAKGQSIQQANLRQIAEKPILVKPDINFGRWISYDQYRLEYPDKPYFTRQILPNEMVFDFDRDAWSDNLFNCQKLINTLKNNNIPYWLAYSGGKGLHTHVFFDMNSLTIDQDVINKAKEELVDIDKTIRVAIWNKIIVWANIDRKEAKLDFGKVNFNSDKKGSMLRDFETPREKNGVTTFKTLIEDIPEDLPKPEDLILEFPGAPVLWDVSHLTSDLEKAIQARTRQYKRSTIDVSLEGVGVSDVYCLQKLIKDGIPDQAPVYYAAYSIARGCHDLGLTRDQADDNVTAFLTKCNISEDDRQVRHDNALNGYDQDQHHLSCSAIKENYGDEYCSKSCSIYQKRRDAKLTEKGATTKVEKELFTAMGEFPGPLQMAQHMQEKHPVYYDKTRSYWLWMHDEKRYVMVDETDILNAIYRITKMNNLVQGKLRSELLTAIQMTGRLLNPTDPNKNWIQFLDHCVDVREKVTIEPTPDYMFTSRIPHKVGDTQDTPYIDSLFTDWVGEDNKQILYEICAYCMLSDYPIHRMFWLVGSGRNGKDQFIELVNRLIGRDNCTATDLERIADSRFESSKLYKKLVGCVGETDHGVLKKTNLLKALTGGSPISGEFKNKTPFDFWNYAKILIASNSVPMVEDKTDGWFARNIFIEFPNKFGEGNDVLGKITEPEYENLCRKCINILPGLLECGKFTNERSLLEKRQEYENKSNPIGQFINEECDVGYEYIMPFWHFFDVLTVFLEKKGLRTYTKTTVRQELKMAEYGFEPDHRFSEYIKNGRWTALKGIQLKNSPYETWVSEKDPESSKSSKSSNSERPQAALCGGVEEMEDNIHSVPHVCIVSESSPPSPPSPPSVIIDQSVKMFETVKKETLNSTNIDVFIRMFQAGNPGTTKEHIINYLEHIGRLTPKVKSNGDKSCFICGDPGVHKSVRTINRNEEIIEWRCVKCYGIYSNGQEVRA